MANIQAEVQLALDILDRGSISLPWVNYLLKVNYTELTTWQEYRERVTLLNDQGYSIPLEYGASKYSDIPQTYPLTAIPEEFSEPLLLLLNNKVKSLVGQSLDQLLKDANNV